MCIITWIFFIEPWIQFNFFQIGAFYVDKCLDVMIPMEISYLYKFSIIFLHLFGILWVFNVWYLLVWRPIRRILSDSLVQFDIWDGYINTSSFIIHDYLLTQNFYVSASVRIWHFMIFEKLYCCFEVECIESVGCFGRMSIFTRKILSPWALVIY